MTPADSNVLSRTLEFDRLLGPNGRWSNQRNARRSVVLSTGTLALAALAGCSGGSGSGGDATATETSVDDGDGGSGDANFDGWMEDVGNYDGVADETGSDEVAVAVGAQGNGGAYAFDPAAIRIPTGRPSSGIGRDRAPSTTSLPRGRLRERLLPGGGVHLRAHVPGGGSL
jgi:hypothetical protein